MVQFFILLLATGLGVGYLPGAPGTFGTILTIPIYFFISEIPSPKYEFILIGFFLLSIWVSKRAESCFKRKDDQRIVIDEMMGFLITMVWLPKTIYSIGIGFIFFRLFDILKPFPIRHMERRWGGGIGVVLDDMLAGIYANISLNIISLIFPFSI